MVRIAVLRLCAMSNCTDVGGRGRDTYVQKKSQCCLFWFTLSGLLLSFLWENLFLVVLCFKAFEPFYKTKLINVFNNVTFFSCYFCFIVFLCEDQYSLFYREEESLVEQFVFEALVTYMESLALAHTDEKSLGRFYVIFGVHANFVCLTSLFHSGFKPVVFQDGVLRSRTQDDTFLRSSIQGDTCKGEICPCSASNPVCKRVCRALLF